jgi:flagellar biosynthesis protein FlhG
MTQGTSGTRRGTIIAITSGKGGVGKTSVVVNLASSLARLGHRVGILDADFGLGNIDVMLGLMPPFHLGHFLSGERSLDEIIVKGPLGIRIIPAGTGIRALTALTPQQWQQLADVVRRISADLDFLLIDTAAGISDNVVELLLLAERILAVTSLEPPAIVDAYALVKILTSANRSKEIGVVVNGARDANEASLVFRQLDVASGRFLRRSLQLTGFIVQDPSLRDAVLGQRPIVDYAPQAPASRCFRMLASRIAGTLPGSAGLRIAPKPSPLVRGGRASQETSQCA